jgi:hypothetical protein
MGELLAYIRECWGTAIAIRERRKATLSMLGAFSALPVVLVFGGKPEFTAQGIVFFAEWLFVSAFLYVFVLAPFLVWKDQRRSLVSLNGRKLPRLGSLPFHNLSSEIIIEPYGDNRLDVSVSVLNQNSELLRCFSHVETSINGVPVNRIRSQPSLVAGNNYMTISMSVPNVDLEPINAMVSAINVAMKYTVSYALAEFQNAPSRTTSKTITFRAPIHMTGKSALTKVQTDFTDEEET